VVIVAIVAPAMVAIPVVIVFDVPARSVPESCIEHSTFMARSHPTCASIRRASPVTIMPAVTASIGIPITVHPEVTWSGGHRLNAHHARRRGRPNTNSKGDLTQSKSRG